jgi:hypothetical protein
MAEAHVDHPGEMSWFVGHGPAPVIGPCPHTDCQHYGQTVIAWGPDAEHYELVQCDGRNGFDQCDGACRGWTRVVRGQARGGQSWVKVDLSQERSTTRESRRGFAPVSAGSNG